MSNQWSNDSLLKSLNQWRMTNDLFIDSLSGELVTNESWCLINDPSISLKERWATKVNKALSIYDQVRRFQPDSSTKQEPDLSLRFLIQCSGTCWGPPINTSSITIIITESNVNYWTVMSNQWSNDSILKSLNQWRMTNELFIEQWISN